MTSVGERLRRERIDRGIDLATLSSLTRISQNYLQAIETGNMAELPSGFFYRSFVRQYASALGLGTDLVESELERVRQAEIPALSAALEQAEFPIKRQAPHISKLNGRSLVASTTWASAWLLVAVLALCSTFYAWWHGWKPAFALKHQIPPIVIPPFDPARTETQMAGRGRAPEDVVLPTTTQSLPNQRRSSSPGEEITLAQRASVPPALESPSLGKAAVPPTSHNPKPEDLATKPESASPVPEVRASRTTYLQVAALAKAQAELFVDALEKKGFHAIYTRASVPNTYRVLVGPFQDAEALAQARTNLNKAGFKRYEAFMRNHSRIRPLSRRRARSV